MRKSNSNENSAVIPSGAIECDVSTDKKAAKALANATEKYAHVVPGTIWKHADGKHFVVLILCTHPDCTAKRAIFTSDCFQVSTCADHKKSASKSLTAKAPKAKGEKAPRKGAKSKDATKATRKVRGQGKATPRARKAQTTAKPEATTTEEVK